MLKMFGDNKLKTSPNFTLPLKFPETNLSSIDAKAGEILFLTLRYLIKGFIKDLD